MSASVDPVTGLPAWKALCAHHGVVSGLHLRQLFAADPGRGERMALERLGIYRSTNRLIRRYRKWRGPS